jgi:hypothetical protein
MDCLSKCAVDVRRALAARVVPCGGGAMLAGEPRSRNPICATTDNVRGFNARLLDDLRAAGAPWDFKIPKVACVPFPLWYRSAAGWRLVELARVSFGAASRGRSSAGSARRCWRLRRPRNYPAFPRTNWNKTACLTFSQSRRGPRTCPSCTRARGPLWPSNSTVVHLVPRGTYSSVLETRGAEVNRHRRGRVWLIWISVSYGRPAPRVAGRCARRWPRTRRA